MQEVNHPSDSSLKDFPLLICVTALFEREFTIDWLEELLEMKASQILLILEEGIQQGWLTRKKPGIYLFENIKKRQEVLDRFPTGEIDRFHGRLADLLMRDLPDDDLKALDIAQHLLHIKNDWKRCQWLLRAGEIHIMSFRTEMAVQCFEKVLQDLSRVKGVNEDWLFIKAAIEYSDLSTARNNTLLIFSVLQDAKARAKRLNKRSYEIILEMHIAKNEWLRSQFNKAVGHFEHALSKAKEMNDPELAGPTAIFSTYFLFWQGRFKDVIQIYEMSMPDVERYPKGHFPLIAANTVGRSYAMIGQFTQGLGMLDSIRDYCLQKGNLYVAASAGSSIAMTLLSINRLEDAFRYLKSSLGEAKQSGNYWVKLIVMFMLALAHFRKGNKKQSLEYLRQFLQNSREVHVSHQLHPYLMEICWAMENKDLPQISDLSLEEEIRRMLMIKNVFFKGIAYRYQALLGKRKNWPNQKITRSFNLSVKWLKTSGSQIELAKSQLELARHYLSMGDEKKGKKTMRIASELLSSTHIDLVPDDLKTLVGNQNLEGAILNEILNLESEMVILQDKKKLLQQIVVTVNRITGAERGAILLLDQETPPFKLKLRASKNLTIEQIHHPNFASSIKMIEEVVSSGKGQFYEISLTEDLQSFSNEVIRSRICVPLFLNERVIGVLYHDNRLLRSIFKESDLKLLTYFGALASLDLDSANAYQEVQRLHQKLIEKERFREKDDIQIHHYEGIVGKSPAIQQVLAQVDQVAKTDTTALILGETGVGKDLVARAIHLHSLRGEGPFISVQCSALTETLITSELFGHEKGAFTGATYRGIGRFELANGGTLFLDEIGDIPLEVQGRLMRVLQSKEFERVGGGNETLTSDFRLIAATNRNLEQEVQANRFRADLYYRINVFPIHIPPLRERKEDIPLLIQFFLKLYASKHQKNLDKIPGEVMEKLIQYDWPGNIRELENIIQRSIIAGPEHHFQLLPLELEIGKSKVARPSTFNTLKENERQHILEALNRSGWKIHGPDGAAEILEINPSTLSSRIKKLGIKRLPKGFLRPNLN